jgi:hypothetical protein
MLHGTIDLTAGSRPAADVHLRIGIRRREEVYAGAFGRRKVKEACQSQGCARADGS